MDKGIYPWIRRAQFLLYSLEDSSPIKSGSSLPLRECFARTWKNTAAECWKPWRPFTGRVRNKGVIEIDSHEAAMMVVGLTDYCFHLDYIHPKNMDPGGTERLLNRAFRVLLGGNDL
jgi:hypothetical protein